MDQERLDEVVVTSPFTLEEAISSLRFYWNLAKHKGESVTMEIWARSGKVVPQKELPRSTEVQKLYQGYAEV